MNTGKIRTTLLAMLTGISLMSACSRIAAGDAADSLAARLPRPAESADADFLPQAPGDAFQTGFASSPEATADRAPAISEWNRTTHPGESFTMTGARFTLRDGEAAGSDTTVWIWADTPTGGELRQARVWSVRDSILTATLPKDIPFGTYLVWVENEAGIGPPAAVNRTTGQWIGPLGNKARAGETKRVFGRNLATDHGTKDSHVFIRAADGTELQRCKVTRVDPYAVTFVVPENLPDGDYEVYVHNGHGGKFGWGEPVRLTVHSEERSDRQVVISPDAPKLAETLQQAVDRMSEQPGGGTVRLAAGKFDVTAEVVVRSGVRLAGAGMDKTFYRGSTLRVMSRTAVEDMTLAQGVKAHESSPAVLEDVRFAGIDTLRMAWRGMWHRRIEVADSIVPIIDVPGEDMHFHGNRLSGDRMYDHAGIYPFGSRVIIEANHFENDWPVDEEGNKLLETSDAIPREHRRAPGPPWIARVVCIGGRGYKPIMDRHYIAHNTSTDVTCEQNIGEMILFHDHRGTWFGQVADAEGKTLRVRTERRIDGREMRLMGLDAGGPIAGDVGDYAVIVGGTGIGQARRIADISDDRETLTLDRAWRITPAGDSRIVITRLWVDNVVYRNELNAFPEGYRLTTHSASTGINIWGNAWNTAAEGNVSRRTNGGRNIRGVPLCPSYWNEFRDEQAYERFHRGAYQIAGRPQPDRRDYRSTGPAPGALTLGNVVRGGVLRQNEHPRGGEDTPLVSAVAGGPVPFKPLAHVGNIVEGLEVGTSGLGVAHGDMAQMLLRNNVFHLLADHKSVGARIAAGADALLCGNRYVNAEQTYAQTGFASRPIALHGVVHLSGRAGAELPATSVPVANAGVAPMEWRVETDGPWIETERDQDGALAPETVGHIRVTADATELSAGVHTGRLYIVAGDQRVPITVRLHLE